MLPYRGIPNQFEVQGTHTGSAAFRRQDHVLPFFGPSFSFDGKGR